VAEDVDAHFVDEREQLRRLQGSLRAERERVLAESAAEIARAQSELRQAAQHAAERERELEALQARLERKLEGRRFFRRARRAEPDGAQDDGAWQRVLAEREQALARHEELLKEREQELAEREQRLVQLSESRPERSQAPPRARPRAVAPASTFADGLRALAGGAASVEPAAEDDAGSW
jgi:exonuclease VII large subunit